MVGKKVKSIIPQSFQSHKVNNEEKLGGSSCRWCDSNKDVIFTETPVLKRK